MDLFSRTVKACGKILPDSVQGSLLRSLKMLGREERRDELLEAMNENFFGEGGKIVHRLYVKTNEHLGVLSGLFYF